MAGRLESGVGIATAQLGDRKRRLASGPGVYRPDLKQDRAHQGNNKGKTKEKKTTHWLLLLFHGGPEGARGTDQRSFLNLGRRLP